MTGRDGTGRTKDPDSSTARASRGNNRRQLSPSAGRGRVSAAASFQTLRCTRALTARNTHSPPAPPASYKASADRGTGRRMQGPGERRVELTDTPTSMLPGISRKRKMRSKFDDSLDSASRKTYRISLRSSSLGEPRHPSLKVLLQRFVVVSGRGLSNPTQPTHRLRFTHRSWWFRR